MLDIIKSALKPFFEHGASKTASITQSLISKDVAPPIKWVSDSFIWSLATQKPIEQGMNGTTFLGVMKQFYECLEKYNDTKTDHEKVLLFVTEETDRLLKNVLPRPMQSYVPIRNLDGFAFYSGGKYYKAYYLDDHEDVGFRVYKDEDYAYLRIVSPTVDKFETFMQQVVYRKDPNPKLYL